MPQEPGSAAWRVSHFLTLQRLRLQLGVACSMRQSRTAKTESGHGQRTRKQRRPCTARTGHAAHSGQRAADAMQHVHVRLCAHYGASAGSAGVRKYACLRACACERVCVFARAWACMCACAAVKQRRRAGARAWARAVHAAGRTIGSAPSAYRSGADFAAARACASSVPASSHAVRPRRGAAVCMLACSHASSHAVHVVGCTAGGSHGTAPERLAIA